MKQLQSITLAEVSSVYSGPEGDFWELLMGHQIHIGGLGSSMELAERAGIGSGQHGVDLCCCTGAGMRFLVRFRDVVAMTGVDATSAVLKRAEERSRDEGLDDRLRFVLADACRTGLPSGEADFVWGEDAWCYVEDKAALIAEAARLVRSGGTVAFTDWVEGPAGLDVVEARRLLRFMKFPSLCRIEDYRGLLEKSDCDVVESEDTGRFHPYVELYQQMIDMQLTWDALRILAFDRETFENVRKGLRFLGELARSHKITQGRFIARKR